MKRTQSISLTPEYVLEIENEIHRMLRQYLMIGAPQEKGRKRRAMHHKRALQIRDQFHKAQQPLPDQLEELIKYTKGRRTLHSYSKDPEEDKRLAQVTNRFNKEVRVNFLAHTLAMKFDVPAKGQPVPEVICRYASDVLNEIGGLRPTGVPNKGGDRRRTLRNLLKTTSFIKRWEEKRERYRDQKKPTEIQIEIVKRALSMKGTDST